ncbi:putative inner membrane protein [Salmonella enterica subsp. arizonae]|uniref:Putative inner membrane protein n=1 Tax=Salmonella enterica subsp. arizonae TaxID=59203 RepID=A0A379SJ73_SALER|nr:putative inner membrane protein [Salmonella enterica subsp. arizonae]
MAIFIVAWGVGILLFFVVKQKAHINNLSFLRLFLAAISFFIPIVIEFSILTNSFLWELFFVVLLVALFLSVGIRFYSN